MKNLKRQNPGQLFVAQELINKVIKLNYSVAELREKKLGCAIPEVYRNFLMNVSNGFDIMNCTLALHGCRTSYNRSDLDSWYPFSLEDIQKYERPKNATLEMFFFASYNYDCSKLYLNTSDNKIYYCDRYDATPLKSWDSLSAMLTSEIGIFSKCP